jgi:hypothetical protein
MIEELELLFLDQLSGLLGVRKRWMGTRGFVGK